ncbi:hypothetical protein WISP_38614 [Willisornis vidua]|uniref:Uncharacterized protein n=1 Tax=Willisornis vidua TaxID=1566151 RepID=A0ABQ9DNE6_9PASS|nr:hypothetical protein WISP_38614 [Willisornis vidua]
MVDSRWPLDPDIEVVVTIDVTSRSVNDNKVKISYYGREGNELAVAWLYLTCVGGESPTHYKAVLGPDKLSYVLDHVGNGENTFYVEGLAFPDKGFSGVVSISASLLEVPHKNSPGTPIFTDTVVFRVAPWIMTPNTQQPLEVFVCRWEYLGREPDWWGRCNPEEKRLEEPLQVLQVLPSACSIKQGSDSNEAFLEGLRVLLRKANCKLTICSEQDTRSDRWIQVIHPCLLRNPCPCLLWSLPGSWDTF